MRSSPSLPAGPAEVFLARNQPFLDEDVADGAQHPEDLLVALRILLLEALYAREQRGELRVARGLLRRTFEGVLLLVRLLLPQWFAVVVPADGRLDRLRRSDHRLDRLTNRCGDGAQVLGVRRVVGSDLQDFAASVAADGDDAQALTGLNRDELEQFGRDREGLRRGARNAQLVGLRPAEQLIGDVAQVDEDAAQVAPQGLLLLPGALELLLVDGPMAEQEFLELQSWHWHASPQATSTARRAAPPRTPASRSGECRRPR